MNASQWVNLILVALALGGGAIGWVYKKLQEQAAIKKVQAERERLREQELRTGRVEAPPAGGVVISQSLPPGGSNSPVGHADARRRLQELAERRQRQLEELRRRQQSQGQGAPAAPVYVPPPPPPPMPPPSRTPPRQTVQPMGRQGPPLRPTPPVVTFGQRPAQQRPPVRPTRTPVPVAPAKDQEAKRRGKERAARKAAAERERAQTEAEAATPERSRNTMNVQHMMSDAAKAPLEWGMKKMVDTILLPKSPADWRRAILMREILSAPITIREDESNGIV